MTTFLVGFMIFTAILVLYWVLIGQRKYNEMLNTPKKTELKAVIFDLDGVIIDSLETWFSIFNQVRKDYQLKPYTKQQFLSKVWGGSVQRDARFHFKKPVGEVETKYRAYLHKFYTKSTLMEGTLQTLKEIRKKGYKIGMVSNSFADLVKKVLKKHKVESYFDVIVGGDQVQYQKPHPEPLLKACELLKIEPNEAIYVGDTVNDYKAAKQAHIYLLGLNYNKADLVISKLTDIIPLLKERKNP